MAALVQDNPTIGWRQLAIIDTQGETAYYHGDRISSIHAAAQGNAVCAIGNILRSEDVPQAMVEAFGQEPEAHLAERLLRALEAGLEAGGELKQVQSAALLVVHEQPFPLVDLRVELDPQPLAAAAVSLGALPTADGETFMKALPSPRRMKWASIPTSRPTQITRRKYALRGRSAGVPCTGNLASRRHASCKFSTRSVVALMGIPRNSRRVWKERGLEDKAWIKHFPN